MSDKTADYQNTETEQTEVERIRQLTFAQISKLILKDINDPNNKSSITVRYSKEQIVRFLENPQKFQKELRILSRYLYNNSANYRRLIWHFAGLLRFDYIVEPYDLDIEKVDVDKFKKQYGRTIKFLETMNIQHEMVKVLKIAFKEDVFYGYEYMTDDSYFIQKLDPNLCRISSIEDGVFNFEYDFASFDGNISKLKSLPDEFQNKYKEYTKDKTGMRWQELDSENTICIKVNEELDFPIPPFNTVFESVFDIDETKRLRKIKTKIDNYMILTQKIPIDDKKGEPNQFLIDLDTAINFHNKASQSLPEEVGLVTSPMDIEAIKLERKNNDIDTVAQTERDFYNAAGVSQLLFNSDKATGTALSKSISSDEQIAFMILKQIERWLNRKLKFNSKAYKFRVKFLETTRYNVDSVQDKLLKAAQFGMPVKRALAASHGMTPSEFSGSMFLENSIMELHDKLIPLKSAHTTPGGEDAGAPSKSDDELSESGEKTRDNDGNMRE